MLCLLYLRRCERLQVARAHRLFFWQPTFDCNNFFCMEKLLLLRNLFRMLKLKHLEMYVCSIFKLYFSNTFNPRTPQTSTPFNVYSPWVSSTPSLSFVFIFYFINVNHCKISIGMITILNETRCKFKTNFSFFFTFFVINFHNRKNVLSNTSCCKKFHETK